MRVCVCAWAAAWFFTHSWQRCPSKRCPSEQWHVLQQALGAGRALGLQASCRTQPAPWRGIEGSLSWGSHLLFAGIFMRAKLPEQLQLPRKAVHPIPLLAEEFYPRHIC